MHVADRLRDRPVPLSSSNRAAYVATSTPVLVAWVAVVASGMAYTLWWGSLVHHVNVWIVPGDIWGTFRDAHIIGWGGEGILYTSGVERLTGFIGPPGMPLLLAPVAMVAGALHLSESLPTTLAHPTAWLLLGPLEMACGAAALLPLDAMGRRLKLSRRRRLATLWIEAALIWPVVALWGHPEDLIALGLALYALLSSLNGRWVLSAMLLGAALAFQPLVVLLVPIAMALHPWRRWASFLAISVAPCALLLFAPLSYAWKTTIRVLVDQPTFPSVDHPTPWMVLSHVLQHATALHGVALPGSGAAGAVLRSTTTHVGPIVSGGPSRLIALGASIGVAAVVARRRPSEPWTWWMAALTLGSRCVFESVMTPYYVVPALLLAVVLGARATRWRMALVVGFAALCTFLSYRHAGAWSYYLPFVAALLAAVAAGLPCRFIQRRPLGSLNAACDDSVRSPKHVSPRELTPA